MSDHAARTLSDEHRFEIRVYYEDTDLAGIVYYANYLKFIERARSEMLRARGVDQSRMKSELGLVFVVRRVEIDYRVPALFDDMLEVRTRIVSVGGARIRLEQDVCRGQDVLAASKVEVACADVSGGAARMPDEIRASLRG